MEFWKVLSLRRRQETDHETGRIGQAEEESSRLRKKSRGEKASRRSSSGVEVEGNRHSGGPCYGHGAAIAVKSRDL